MKSHRLLNASERWFRLLLRFYPPDFRDEMGGALVETYRDRAREALEEGGLSRLAAVWVAAFRDSVRNGLGERISPAVAWRRAGDWGRDLDTVGRRLRQKPLFVLAVLATLTVGLGTFAVVYTAVDKILMEPLPYKDADDLYMVWCKCGDLPHLSVSGPQVKGLQNAGGVIESAAGMGFGRGTLLPTESTEAARVTVLSVSPNMFDLLGVQPAMGRGFRPDDISAGAAEVAVISDRLWKRLGGRSEIIGTKFQLSASLNTVVGVMPPDFYFAGSQPDEESKPDVYVPADFTQGEPDNSSYQAVIRARRGIPEEEVSRQVDAIGRFVAESHKTPGKELFPIGVQAEMVDSVRPALLALSFAGIFLVLVLGVNLASLLLARAAEREREFAVSRAVGANGIAVVRATLFEGGLLGLAGGIAGALVGIWGTRLLVDLGPSDLPRRESIALDWEVAAVVTLVGALVGLLAAAAPATWAARTSLSSLMAASAVRGSASSNRMRRGLIVVQVALSLVLLSSAGLIVGSFQRLLAADPGFKPSGALTFELGLGGEWMFPKIEDMYAFLNRVDEGVLALPGVKAVSSTTQLPLSGGQNAAGVRIPGAPGNTGDPDKDRRTVGRIFIRAGYIEAMGMRLIEGRDFTPVHRPDVLEALIDRHLAKQFFPNGSALGAKIPTGERQTTVVGVIDQARLYRLHEDDSLPQFFVRAEDYPPRRPSLYVVRTDREPSSLLPEVRAVVNEIDPRVTISHVQTLNEIVAEKRSEARISAVLIGGLAIGALLLVAMGLFGVISGSVAQRRGELAVRLALGATHDRVIRVVVIEGLRLVALGLLLGIPGIYMAGQAIGGLLVGVSPFDTLTLATVAIVLFAVALAACYLAARRVTTIEPEQLLREG